MSARILVASAVMLLCVAAIAEPPDALSGLSNADQIRAAIDAGAFTRAEQLLREQIENPDAPVTSPAAIQLEILRRTRYDFSLTEAKFLKLLRVAIMDVTADDLARWRLAGALDFRTIDGEIRYFRRAPQNLLRFSEDARQRNALTIRSLEKFVPDPGEPVPKFDLTALITQLVDLAEKSDAPEVYPVRHNVRYEVRINEAHPRLRPGARVRAWLPFPQAYRQQRDVRLIRCEPPGATIAPETAPQRSIFFQQTLADPPAAPRFMVEFEFVTAAYCPKLDPAQVRPYYRDAPLYREFTAERPPHIVFTPEVRALAAEIVGDEANPLERARCIFRWVSQNIRWCGEMEYSIIPNLSAKGLAARRGDCGVQGMTFITLCRAAGVPARWQSGWQLQPGDWNMHDWSEIYIEPWGWLPADASHGLRDSEDPRVRDFLCGHMDPYRLIVNLDYGRDLQPPTLGFRSEPNDFQRGEIEIDGHNLYFDEWTWDFQVESTPLDAAAPGTPARP